MIYDSFNSVVNGHISAYALCFGTIKDIASAFYGNKNQVRGLCVGEDMVILNAAKGI